MAAAQAQLQNAMEHISQQNEPSTLHDNRYPQFDDTPTAQGILQLEAMDQKLTQKLLYQVDCGRCAITQDDPGNPNGPNPGNAVQQGQHRDRDSQAKIIINSFVNASSMLYTIINNAPFVNSFQMRAYISGPGVTYLPPTALETEEFDTRFRNLTYESVAKEKKTKDWIFSFGALVKSFNQYKHPAWNKTEAENIDQLVRGIHPSLKIIARKMIANNAFATQEGVMHPAVIAAHMPNGGQAHPQAGQRSFDLIVRWLDGEFKARIGTEVKLPLFRVPEVNMIHQPSASDGGAGTLHTYYSWGEDAAYLISSGIGRRPFLSCKSCGGVNHKEGEYREDGTYERKCPTPENSVPPELLQKIRYPFGVTAWRFGAGKGGKGKGKGIGKGRGGARGRGRGVRFGNVGSTSGSINAVVDPMALFQAVEDMHHQYDLDDNVDDAADAVAEAQVSEATAAEDESVNAIFEDFDGFNNEY